MLMSREAFIYLMFLHFHIIWRATGRLAFDQQSKLNIKSCRQSCWGSFFIIISGWFCCLLAGKEGNVSMFGVDISLTQSSDVEVKQAAEIPHELAEPATWASGGHTLIQLSLDNLAGQDFWCIRIEELKRMVRSEFSHAVKYHKL